MGTRSDNAPWYERKAASGTDAVLFFLAVVVGAAGVFWLKRFGYTQATVTAVPCGVLLAYAAIVKFVPRFQIRDDQAGDNCYYLGFLFTLFSLSLALAAFAEAGGTTKIIEDFGIALATTILGLTLRVAFSQMGQDSVEVEREARIELATAAQRLRSEIDQSVQEMNMFRRASQQSTADGLEELNTKVGELMGKTLTRYDEIAQGSAKRIDDTLSAFASNARHLNDEAEKAATAIEDLSARVGAIRAPPDLVEDMLAPAAAAVAEMMVDLKRRAGAESQEFRQLRKLIKGANTAAEGLEGKLADIDRVFDGLAELGSTLSDMERSLGAFGRNLERAGEALVVGSTEWRKTLVAEAEGTRAVFENANKSVAAMTEELHATLREPARAAGMSLKAIAAQGENLQKLEAHLKRLPEPIEALIESLSRLQSEALESHRSFRFPWRR